MHKIEFNTIDFPVNLNLKYQVYQNDILINSFKSKSEAHDYILNCIKNQMNGFNPIYKKYHVVKSS